MGRQSDSRRRVILGITGAIAGAGQLPSKWTKPVIKTIVLPAHAQSSVTTTPAPSTTPDPSTTPNPSTTPDPTTTADPTTTTTTPCPNTTFTIPGGSATCGNFMNDFNFYQIVFDANGCPNLVSGGNDVIVQFLVNNIRALIKVTVGGTLIRGNLTCNAPRTSRRSGNPTFTASDGSTWQASVSMTGDGVDTVTLQNIVVTKL